MSQDTLIRDQVFPVSDQQIHQAFYLVLFAVIGALMIVSLGLSFRSRVVPMLVGVPTLVLIALQLLPVNVSKVFDWVLPVSLKPRDADSGESAFFDGMSGGDVGFERGKQQQVALEMIGWCISLAVLVYLFGYYFTLPPYVFAFAWYFHRDVRRAVFVTIVFTVAVILLFLVLFDVSLYTGVLGLPNPLFYL